MVGARRAAYTGRPGLARACGVHSTRYDVVLNEGADVVPVWCCLLRDEVDTVAVMQCQQPSSVCNINDSGLFTSRCFIQSRAARQAGIG